MKHRLLLLLSSIAMMTGLAFAGEIREIELSDGSVITGEILALDKGAYTVKTNAIGTLTIEESKIRAIRSRGSSSSSFSASSAGQNADINSLQQQMINDQQILDKIQSLKDDPQFMKVMEDPEIMKAVNSGDTTALMANPKFLRLMQNPAVKDIQSNISK